MKARKLPATPALGTSLIAGMINKDCRCELDARVYLCGQFGNTTVLIGNLRLGVLEVAVMLTSFLVGFQSLVGIMTFRVSCFEAVKGVAPFITVSLATLLRVTCFAEIATWSPPLVFGRAFRRGRTNSANR